MRNQKLLRKLLGLLLAVGTLAASALPVSAAQVTFTTLIEAQYEDAGQFNEGLAAVKADGKWGYIDETGETVIPFQYDKAYLFREGLALVGKLEQRDVWHATGELDQWGNGVYEEGPADVYVWYVIDAAGKEKPLTAPAYVYDEETQESSYEEQPAYGLCSAVDQQPFDPGYHNGYLNLEGYVNLGEPENLVYDRQGNRLDFGWNIASLAFNEGVFVGYTEGAAGFCVLDAAGKVVLSSEDNYQVATVRPFNQDMAPALCYTEAMNFAGTWGFLDRSGNMVIPAKYQDFYVNGPLTEYKVFNDGIAVVQSMDGKWGGINKNGVTVIPFAYDSLRVFHEGLAAAEQGGKWGVIDTANRVVVPFQYDTLSGFNEGLCVAVRNGRAFCIDRNGNEVPGSDSVDTSIYFPEGTDSMAVFTPERIVVVEQDDKYGFMTMDYTADLPQPSEMDSWAYGEVVQAIEAGLIPMDLQNQYRANITRADFAALAVELITTETGKTAEELVLEATGQTMAELVASYPFTDANSTDVLVANALGIINGKGNGIFDPYGLLSRQDAAAILMRTGRYLGKTETGGSAAAFTDRNAIAGYAQEAVDYVSALGVMNGTSADTFSPLGNYTRQQAYLTVCRLYEALQS
ncbi:WG repeat-containing protein [Candidatus Avoscillospira sp. LCP25S3_F1]|uniref:WG repeat-containing protein n=1 Tax=Candidatus Avoscillospira sp. LCP25S3_F1 TaxID=3438825 RepID=UPI003F8F3A13